MSEWKLSAGKVEDALRYADQELSRLKGSRARLALDGIRRIIDGGSWEIHYGWVARFEDGEEYDESGSFATLAGARAKAAQYQAEEDANPELPGRLTYSVRQRLVYVSDRWDEVPGD